MVFVHTVGFFQETDEVGLWKKTTQNPRVSRSANTLVKVASRYAETLEVDGDTKLMCRN